MGPKEKNPMKSKGRKTTPSFFPRRFYGARELSQGSPLRFDRSRGANISGPDKAPFCAPVSALLMGKMKKNFFCGEHYLFV
jgi:hypothetical protein